MMNKLAQKTVRGGISRFHIRSYSKVPDHDEQIILNPHAWKGLPADRIFMLHKLRKDFLGNKYVPNDDERNAILSTFSSLSSSKPTLEYSYEIDNFKERFMNNTPVNLRGRPPRRSNINVISKGSTPHDERRYEQLHRVSAFEMPLLSKFRQEYVPKPDKETPIRLTFRSTLGGLNHEMVNKVSLSCSIKDLGLEKNQERKLKVLSGDKFNHLKNTIKFSTSRYPESTQNARWLVQTFNKLIESSKDLGDDLSDIPIDTRHLKIKKENPKYPVEWKRPDNAPEKRHMITRKLVDLVMKHHDRKYISKYSP